MQSHKDGERPRNHKYEVQDFTLPLQLIASQHAKCAISVAIEISVVMKPKRLHKIVVPGMAFLVLGVFFWIRREPTPGPIYKNISKARTSLPISDNFPLLGDLDRKLPAIPTWNQPPSPHVNESTPLFIGFTRNWPLLQQCVLSYITAGWPPEDIYVVDNTGTMKSNFPPAPKLTLQNPFYLNVTRLQDVFRVNVISTPTLLTFAQLQNFYIFTSLERGWDYYFWSHMDILAFTEEKWEGKPFLSLYQRALDKLREATSPEYLLNKDNGIKGEWAIQFFAYDWLALNNVKSFLKIGGWDTFISYYTADCDMHARFQMAGVLMPVADCGRIADVGGSIDLNLLFRRKLDRGNSLQTLGDLDSLPEDERGGTGFDKLVEAVKVQQGVKTRRGEERNQWQYKQTGGQGEPFYRDPQGFEKALQMVIATGVRTYREKWGWKTCDLHAGHLGLGDAWQVKKNYYETPQWLSEIWDA